MTVIYVDDGNPDGVCVGQNSTTSKIGFYGKAPVVKTSVTALAGTAAVFSEAKTGMWAFATSTAAKAVDVNVRAMHAALKAVGLI